MRNFKLILLLCVITKIQPVYSEVDVGWLLDDKFKMHHVLGDLVVDSSLKEWIETAESGEYWLPRDEKGLVRGRRSDVPNYTWPVVLELCTTFFALNASKTPEAPVSDHELRMAQFASIWLDWELRKNYLPTVLVSRLHVRQDIQEVVFEALQRQLKVNVRRLNREIDARKSKPKYAERIDRTFGQCIFLSDFLNQAKRPSS